MNTQELKRHAYSLGFDRIGITSANTPDDFHRYEAWIRSGFAADLWYLTETTRIEKRKDLSKILPGVASVIVGAMSYAPASQRHASDAKIARYAWGYDYHDIVLTRLEKLAEWMVAQSDTPFRYLTYTDTGPILERSLAQRAGVGWIGKNTCVLHASTGSYIFLGEILTTLALPPDAPATDHCGTCTRCLDACPTSAFTGPYQLDASRCISYQTIENRGDIPESISSKLDGWVAGCDVCQEVCPWNEKAHATGVEEFAPKAHTALSLSDMRDITSTDFKKYFGKTALKRLGAQRLHRNARVALEPKRGMIRAPKANKTEEAVES